MIEREPLSVSELNARIKGLIESDPVLGSVYVRGELSNYKVYPSGHHYFTLKDAESSLRCVMFRSAASKLRFRPESGMRVTAWGRVAVYPRDGAYQLYCEGLMPEGAGDLQVAYEQLKAKLAAEGLFDSANKKPIPRYPERIAVITSSAGAAVHDIIRVLRKRWPVAKVVLLPVRVQGVEAPPEIAGALRYANKYRVADVIITGRGAAGSGDRPRPLAEAHRADGARLPPGHAEPDGLHRPAPPGARLHPPAPGRGGDRALAPRAAGVRPPRGEAGRPQPSEGAGPRLFDSPGRRGPRRARGRAAQGRGQTGSAPLPRRSKVPRGERLRRRRQWL